MSSSVESRIVSMKFDNKDFERGVSTTLKSLGTLSKTLDAGFTSKAASGLSRVGSAIKGFNFGGMSGQVQGLSGKFIALGAIGVTAISRITNSVLDSAGAFLRQFSGLQGMRDGFHEYETQMGSIQTILANTGLTGQKGIDKVNAKLKELNTYSDKTIYNFSEMARNIGTFTAAGVDLNTSVTSIKGIANIAALSGSNAQQASTAMYQLSQAIAAGKVGLQDWNSVVNAGMGGKIFQEALTNTAVAMGKIDESAIKLEGPMKRMVINGQSFRESIMAKPGQESWLSADVLTATLSQFSGDLSKADLKAQGFNDAQIKRIQQQAKAAQDAATKVKTFTQLVQTIQEAIGSGWAQTFGIIVGDFGEAKKLFTSLSNTIGGFIQRSAAQRNKMLQDWKDAGGRDDLIAGFANLWRVVLKVIRPIHNAFRDIFPRSTGEQLASITEGFRKLTEGMLFGKKYSQDIHKIFRAIFTVIKIGIGIVGALIKYVAEFFGIIITGGGGDAVGAILGLVGKFADLISKIGEFLIEGNRMGKFFDMLIDARNAVLEPIVGVIGNIVEALVALVSGDVSGFFDQLGEAGNSLLDLFGVVGDRISSFGDKVGGFFSELGSGGADAMATVVGKIGEFMDTISNFFTQLGGGAFAKISGLFDSIGDSVDNVKEKLSGSTTSVNVDSGPLDTLAAGLEKLSGVATVFSKIFDVVGTVFGFVGRTIAKVAPRIWSALGTIGDHFLTFVEDLSLDDIIKIINTGVFVMLYRAITRLADSTGGLLGFGGAAKESFEQLTGTLKTMQTAVKANLILSIAGAVALLAASMIALALIPANKLKSAGAAIAGLFAGLVASMKILSGGGGKKGGKLSDVGEQIAGESLQLNLLSVAAAMIGMATAILILSSALLVLQKVDFKTIGKMAIVMGLMVTAMLVLGKGAAVGAAAGAAMFGMAAALVVMAGALKLFEKVKGGAIGKVALVLLELSVSLAALGAIGPAVLAGAAAMLIMAPALFGVALALLLMSKVKPGTIGKLALILLTLSVGLTAMIAALPGAIALGVLAAALTVLMPVMQTLAKMSWGEFLKSLGMVIIAMVGLGTVAAALGALSPLIIAFGLALTTVGVALVLVGGGVLALGIGLGLMAAAGTAAMAVFVTAVTAFLTLLPQWIIQLGQTLDAVIKLINEYGPPFIEAMGKLLIKLLVAINKATPSFMRLMETLIREGLKVVRDTSKDWIDTGIQLIKDFLDGLDKNMDDITDKGTKVILKFLAGVRKNDDKIAKAAVATIISLSLAMGRAIFGVIGYLFNQAKAIGSALVSGIKQGISDLWHTVTDYVQEKINEIPGKIRDLMGISSPSKVTRELGGFISLGLALGIQDHGDKVTGATEKVVTNAKRAMQNSLSQLAAVSVAELQFDPTIRPVVDLSGVEEGGRRIAELLNPSALNPASSLAQAQLIAASVSVANGQNGGDSGQKSGDTIFNQYNNSPKALSPAEIYRGTSNLLSLKLKELTSSNATD